MGESERCKFVRGWEREREAVARTGRCTTAACTVGRAGADGCRVAGSAGRLVACGVSGRDVERSGSAWGRMYADWRGEALAATAPAPGGGRLVAAGLGGGRAVAPCCVGSGLPSSPRTERDESAPSAIAATGQVVGAGAGAASRASPSARAAAGGWSGGRAGGGSLAANLICMTRETRRSTDASVARIISLRERPAPAATSSYSSVSAPASVRRGERCERANSRRSQRSSVCAEGAPGVTTWMASRIAPRNALSRASAGTPSMSSRLSAALTSLSPSESDFSLSSASLACEASIKPYRVS